MAFVFERADGARRQVSGYRLGSKRSRGRAFEADSRAKLPARVDLRPHMTEVEDQGNTSSCVANAVAGAYEYLARRHHNTDTDVSRLFIYYNSRARHGDEDEDAGTEILEAVEGLREYGACAEATWPFDEDMVTEQPSDEAYDEASWFLVDDVRKVPDRLETWKAALAQGYPIMFGLNLYSSFDRHKRRGLVPIPGSREVQRAEHGGHAMLCVGYSDPDRVFIVRNSWGEDWGDRGYCYIPYDYIMNPKFGCEDSWIIRQVEPIVLDDEDWSDEDEPMLEDLDTILSDLDDETFEALNDDLGRIPLETRLATLMYAVSGADGEVSDEELDALAETLDTILDALGSDLDPRRVLRHAAQYAEDERLLRQTIDIFARHLPTDALASLTATLATVADADGLSDDEAHIINLLTQAWQVEDQLFGEDEDEDWDEDDEDDEDWDEDDDEDDEDWDDEDDDY